jgi:hypothetical protein
LVNIRRATCTVQRAKCECYVRGATCECYVPKLALT